MRANPTERVRFIHDFPTWHGDLGAVLDLLRSVDDSAFRSGLCLALGSIDRERLPSDTQRALDGVLADLYTSAPDGGTHSAAGWALAHRGSSLPEIPPTRGPVEARGWFINRLGMTLIAIEPGLFHPYDYDKPSGWDGPLQTIVLTRPFFMADQVVTAEWYRRFLDSDDHPDGEKLTEKSRRPDLSHSVVDLDWASAILFCNWLSRAEGRTPCYRPDASGRLGLTCDFRANGYRLVTDAEFEYAYRYGTTTRFVTGEEVGRLPDYGRLFVDKRGPGRTFYPSPWGLFDMLGNNWQMCWDDGYPYEIPGLMINPVGAVGAGYTIRGGPIEVGLFHLHGSFRYGGNQGAALARLVCGPLDPGADQDARTAALGTLTRWLERFPESRPQIWKERGGLYADLGQADRAAADYARALELAPRSDWIANDIARRDEVFANVVKARPRDAHLWWARADWLGRNGRWRDAAAATARLIDLAPATALCWYWDAVLRLQSGNSEGYRHDCREMLARFREAKHPYMPDYVAKTCLLLPDGVPDLKPVLELARRPLAGMEKDVAYPWFLVTRALADYRAGQFGAAVEGINQVAPKPDGGALDATAFLVLALAEQRRGRPAAARQALTRAAAIRDRNWPQFDRGQHLEGDWADWLRCEVLRREVATLIGPDGGSPHASEKETP